MNYAEYQSVKNYSYEQYCEYLTNKYEQASKVGLFKHHTFENVKANLSNPIVQSTATEEEKNAITYCDFLEHLFLHILIGEQTDARKALGLGGAINYIIPQLNKYFDNNELVYGQEYYQNIDKRTFDILVQRCEGAMGATQIALEHNISVCLQAEKYLEEKGKALVVIGTGLGKTTTALEYLWKHRCRALVIGPNNLIKSGWEEYSDWCDTTTYQTFANNYSQIDYSQYGIVILDEAHHVGYDEDTDKGAAVWSKGIKYIIENGIKVLGLTATPERSDKINIGSTIFEGCVCEGFAVEDGIEKGIIHPFSYVTAYYDTNGIVEEYSNCENKELVGQLDLAINNTPTVKDIFRKHMPNNKRKGIVFIQEIADEQNVVDIMKDVYPDVEMRIIHSKMPQKEVEVNRKWFEETDEGYLLAVNMISEGAHYNGVNTIIMFRRTSSYLVFTQQLGRIITLVKNQDPHAIVFDLVNNIENIEYDNVSKDIKEKHEICKIADRLKEIGAFKSGQIIVADETRNIVECIRKIKKYNIRWWSDEDLQILRQYYPLEGCRISNRLSIKRSNANIKAAAQRYKIKGPSNKLLTKNEEDIIKKYYPIEGTNVIKRFDNLTVRQLRCIVHRMGLKYTNHWWSKDEIDIVKEYYPVEGTMCYTRLKNRTQEQVKDIAKKHNIKHIANEWSDKEDEIIRQYYPIEGGKVYKRLVNRTKGACIRRAKILAVQYDNAWSEVEINILKKYWPCEGINIAERFGKKHTKSSISRKASQLGLRKNMTNKKKVLCIETNMVFDSIAIAMQHTGVSRSSISLVIHNKMQTAGGYHWKYVEEENNV